MAWDYEKIKKNWEEPSTAEVVGKNFLGAAANWLGSQLSSNSQLLMANDDIKQDLMQKMTGGKAPKVLTTTPALPYIRDLGMSMQDWGQNYKAPVQLRDNYLGKDIFDLATDQNFWTDPRGFAAFAGEGLGSTIPSMVLGGGLMKAGITPATWVGGAAKNLLGTTQAGQKLLDLGGRFANTKLGGVLSDMASGGANYGLVSAIPDAMANSAELIKPLKDRGFSDSEIAQLMQKSVARELPMDIAANALQGNVIFGKGLGLFGKTWKGRLGYGAMNIPLEMGTEYFQEGNQTANVNKFLGLPYTENPILNFIKNGKAFDYAQESDAANAGAFGSIIPSAGGTVHHAMFGRDYNNPPQPSQDTSETSQPSSNGSLIDWVHSRDVRGGKISGKESTINKIVAEAQRQGVDPQLALSVGMWESGLNQNVGSDAGAFGVMQLMPETAQDLGVDRYNEDENIKGGVKALKQLLDKYNGNVQLALAAYNAGEGAVNKFGGIPPYGETQAYVPGVLGIYGSKVNQTTPRQTQQQTSQGQGNIFGTENYNMPTQSDRITQQVNQLKNGWQQVIPQIGGVLKNKFGINATISSAARTAEHNAAVGGVPTSHHIIREGGGDALDMVFDRDTTAAERQQILDYFKNTGVFKEVIYHDAGSGYHLHIGGLQTDKLSKTAPAKKKTSAVADDPNFSAVENKMWRLAQRAAKRAKEKYNLNLKPELIYRQWWHETAYQGKSFNSRLLREVNNLGGLKTSGEATNSPAPDGGYYREFNSLEDSADAYVDNYIKHRPELNNVQTIEDWANVMRDTNYYMETDDMTREQAVAAYIAGMKGAKIPNTQGYEETEGDEETTTGETETVERDSSNDELLRSLLEENKTNYNIDDENPINQQFIQDLVQDKLQNGSAEEIAQLGAVLQNFFNENGEFQNTKENRQALAKALGEDNFKNLGQENLNSKLTDYKNFLQTRINPLQEEIAKLEENHKNARDYYDNFRTAEGLQGSGHGRILKGLRQSVIDSKNGWDNKIAELNRANKILNPEPVETAPVEKFTATLNQGAKTKPTDKNLLSMLEVEETPTFNPTSKNAVTRNIIENFIKQKISTTQDKSLKKFLDADNKFISNQTTRKNIADKFGAELQDFGQNELNKRLEELKSRYKIERPVQNNSVEVLPKKSEGAVTEDSIIEQAKGLARQALANNDSKNYFGAIDAIKNQDVSAMRQLVENIAKNQQAKNKSVENISNLQAEINALNKWRAAEQKKLNQAIKSRNQSAYNESDKIIKDLDGRISDLKNSPEYLTELQTELETLKSWRKNAKNNEQISTLDKDIANLEKEIDSTQKPSETSEETAPKKSAVDYQADIAELEKEKSALNKELDKATTTRDYKKADEIEKQISQVEEKIKSAQDDFENFKQNPEYLESLKADLKDNEEFLAKLKRQNKQYGATSTRNKHIKDTEKTISRLQKEIADIEKPAENQEVEVTAELEKATFKSPNTGKKLPIARLKNKVSDAELEELLTLAKELGGNYQRAAKGFVFKNADERDAFISEVNGETQQVEETAEPVQENNSAESQRVDETPRNYFNQLKKEIADLWKQRKAEQKRQLKAAESRDKKTFADSTAKLETLKNKIDSLTEKQTDFKNSPLYQQMLQDEIDDLKSFKQGLEGNKDKESLQEIDKINKEILAKENDLKYYRNLSQVDEIVENKNVKRKENVSHENYSSGVAGSQTTAETDSGAEIELQYKVVPATSLTTSHKLEGDDVFVNKNYPAKLQPRDREGEIERDQVIKMRNNLDTRRLGENIRLNEGAPTVQGDGTVLNGNGRAMAIESAYEEGKADNYKQFLIDNAEKFGLNADDIEQIENPVLVREVTQELDDKTTTDIIKSKIGGVEFKVSEQAIADAESLTLKNFDDYKENVDGDISSASNDDFCRNVLEKIAPSLNERNKYYDKGGKLNGDAIRRINNAIYALAYTDYNLISKNAESTNQENKNISTAAQKAAVDFAKLKLKQNEGLAEEYDIGEVVADAIKLYDQVKDDKNFNSVADYVEQERQNLFEPRQQAVLDMVEVFDAYKRKADDLKDYLKDIAKAADKKPNSNQSQLFDDDYKKARIDELVRNVTSKYLQDKPSGAMTDLFDDSAEEKRRASEQAAREKILAEQEKTESQKIYERGEKRAREKFASENEVAEVGDTAPVTEDNQETQTETSQQEKTETQSQEEFETWQEEMHDENKPSIYREGNKFVVNVGKDIKGLKLGLIGAISKRHGGKYRKGTQTFEFPKASAAMSFATDVEITKMKDDARQKIYRDAKVADFPVLKNLFDAGFKNKQAADTLDFIKNMSNKQRGLFAIEGLLNTYKGDDAKFKKAQNYLSKLKKGTSQNEGVKNAYDRVFDMLYGEEVENGETLPALTAPQTLLNFADENSTTNKKSVYNDKNQQTSQGKSQDEVKEKTIAKNFKARGDKILNDFADGKTDASKTFDKLETLQKISDKNKVLNTANKADVNDYIEKLKNELVDYLHGEKDIEVKSAQENLQQDNSAVEKVTDKQADKEKLYQKFQVDKFPVIKEAIDKLSEEKVKEVVEKNLTEKDILYNALILLEEKYPKVKPTQANYDEYHRQTRERLAKRSELEKQSNRKRNPISAEQAYKEYENFLKNNFEDRKQTKTSKANGAGKIYQDWRDENQNKLENPEIAKLDERANKLLKQLDAGKVSPEAAKKQMDYILNGQQKFEKTPEQIKKSLADLAQKAWSDNNYKETVSFTPSQKFRDKAQEILGHDIDEIFLTADEVRHIKKNHSKDEKERAQVDMTPEMIADSYEIINNFDFAEQGKTDKQGNKAIKVSKNIEGGLGITITTEKGNRKARITSTYKKTSKKKEMQMSDVQSPEPNVQNDSRFPSENNISQKQDSDKEISEQDKQQSAIYSYVNDLHKDDANITLSEVKSNLEKLIGAANVEKFSDKIEKLHRQIHSANAKLGKLKSAKKDKSAETTKAESDLKNIFATANQENKTSEVEEKALEKLNSAGLENTILPEGNYYTRGVAKITTAEMPKDFLNTYGEYNVSVLDALNTLRFRKPIKLLTKHFSTLSQNGDLNYMFKSEDEAKVFNKALEILFNKSKQNNSAEISQQKNSSETEEKNADDKVEVFSKEKGNIEEGIKAVFKAPDGTFIRCDYSDDSSKVFKISYRGKQKQLLEQRKNQGYAGSGWYDAGSTMRDFQRLMGDATKISANISARKKEVAEIQAKEKIINDALATDDNGEIKKILKSNGFNIYSDTEKISEGLFNYTIQKPYSQVLDTVINSLNKNSQSADNDKNKRENNKVKFSGKGELTKMFRNARQLSENELNGKQKKWTEFANDYGLKIVWLDAHKDLKGAVENGIIYLNANTYKDISKTFYHEQFHILSALNPELHKEIINYFNGKNGFTKQQLDNYRKENQREDLTDIEVVEEILSDNFEQVQSRVKILQDMAKDNPSLLKKFINFVKNLADKFVSVFRSPESGMTRTQRDEFIQKFNKLAGSLKDIHGNKIFTTYKDGKELRFANGNKLLDMPLKFLAEKSVDNQQDLNDNVQNDDETAENEILKRLDNQSLMKQITDDMDIGEVREKLLRPENIAVGQLIKVFDKLKNSKGVSKTKLDEIRNNLKEAVLNADDIRKEFNSKGTLREVETALQRQNKIRKGSRLAESFQQQLDAGRTGNLTGRERVQVDQIPGEYRRMYEHEEVKKILQENAKHSEKQGAFSVDDKVKAALANDKSVEVLIKNLGGKIVDGELVADDETRAKINKALDDSGKVKYSIAWHGTPHDFDSFTLQAIGTGEGAQAHGWGLYFADDRKVSEGYKKRLDKGLGRLFKVDIPDTDVMLDEDKRWRNQPKKVKDSIKKLVSELSDDEIGIESRETILDGIMNDPIGRGGFIYSRLSSILGSDKAASERLNKYGIKGITYEGGRDGRCYVIFDDQAIKILEKYSLQGAGDTTIGNYVADENLTSQQKLLKDFSKQMGMTLQFFKNNNKDFHGAYVGGVTYLNTNSKTSLGKVFWHETLHWLKSNNESLYNQLAKATNLTQEQLANYLDTTGRQDLKTNAEITEEILADSLHKVLARVKDKTVLEKVVAWIQNALQKFKDMFRNKQGGLTTAQYNNIADTFGRIAKDLKDEYGNKIFRFNRNTRQLELADGTKLSSIPLTADNATVTTTSDTQSEFEKLQKITPIPVSNEISKNAERGKAINAAMNTFAEKYPEGVSVNTAIGEVTVNKKSIKNSLSHLIYPAKIDSVLSLPEGLKVAAYMESSPDINGKDIMNHFLVYPIQYSGEKRFVFCRVRENVGGKRLYVHGVYSQDEINAKVSAFLQTTSLENQVQRGDTDLYDSIIAKFFAQSKDISTVAKNLGGRFENGEWIFDDDKSKRAFEKHLQNVKNNFEGTKFSAYDSVHNYFNEEVERLSENLGLKGKNIVTDAMEEYNLEKQREKAMQDYIDDPSDANKQRLKDLKVTKSRLEAYKQGKEYDLEIGAIEGNFASPNRIAAKNPIFNYFYQLGRKAMDTLVKKRDTWSKRLENVWSLVKDKQSKQDLTDLLIFGDMNQVEYGVLTDAEKSALPKDNYNAAYTQAQINKIMAETDVSENVAKAYLQVRKLLRAVHEQLDNAKRKPRKHSRYLTDKEIEKLKDNKFVIDIKVTDAVKDGKTLVNYTEFVNREQVYRKITKDALDKMKADKVIQVLKEKEVGEVNGEKIFDVRVREGVAPVGNLKGYFPHCFYEYMIRIKDKDGKIVEDYGEGGVIGSGRTQREAVKLAEDWQKTFTLKEGEYIYIAPKTMNFDKLGMSEKDYAPMMGDKDFDAMTHKIAENHEMKLKDAKELVKGSVRFKNRHRFFGHLQERKGAKGYSTDIEYCLRHYTNQAARYIALETEFKPQAISTFERTFGRFDNDYRNNDNAQYCKEFIEDVNGTPTHLEKQLDKLLAKSGFYRNWLVPAFGERAALTLANKTVDLTSKLTLGMCNISSALLNLTQLINAGGYLGGYGRLSKQLNKLFKNRGKLSRAEIKILNETGVLSDIGLDTATGYDRNRFFNNESTEEGLLGAVENLFNKANWLLDKGMYPFQAVDKLSRIATTLAAYEQAKAKGKTHTEAIEYASELNTKANFEYGVNDAPNIFRRSSVIGKILLQFQKFPIKQLEIMRDMWFNSNKTTRAQKLAFWLPYIAMVGLMGLIPAFNWIDDFIYKMTDWSPKDWVSKGIMKHTPKPVGKFLLYGGGSLVNVDTSKRAGLSDIMPQSLPDFLLGATGSKIVDFTKNMIRGFTVGEEGAYLNALRNVSPGLYNIYAAFEGEMLGNRNRRMSIYETLYDRLIRGIGFKSVDESMAADIKRITSHDRSILNKEKQKAVDAFIQNPSAENLKRLKELEITPATVKKERERKKLDKLGRIDYGETKKERQQNQYLFDFAR